MYLLSQINKNPAITTVIKRGIFGGGKGLLSSSLRNIKALLIYETGSLGFLHGAVGFFLWGVGVRPKAGIRRLIQESSAFRFGGRQSSRLTKKRGFSGNVSRKGKFEVDTLIKP